MGYGELDRCAKIAVPQGGSQRMVAGDDSNFWLDPGKVPASILPEFWQRDRPVCRCVMGVLIDEIAELSIVLSTKLWPKIAKNFSKCELGCKGSPSNQGAGC